MPGDLVSSLFIWNDSGLGEKLESHRLYHRALGERRFRLLQKRDREARHRRDAGRDGGQIEDLLALEMVNVVLILELARIALIRSAEDHLSSPRDAFAAPSFRGTARIFFRRFLGALGAEGAPGRALKRALDGKTGLDLAAMGRQAAGEALAPTHSPLTRQTRRRRFENRTRRD